jgi:hypothetical protein
MTIKAPSHNNDLSGASMFLEYVQYNNLFFFTAEIRGRSRIFNGKDAAPLRTALEEMGHPQLATPTKRKNDDDTHYDDDDDASKASTTAVAVGGLNNNKKKKKRKRPKGGYYEQKGQTAGSTTSSCSKKR